MIYLLWNRGSGGSRPTPPTPPPPPAKYTYATLADAQAVLSARLFDSSATFWPASELAYYLQEALRVWNAFTSVWRAEFPFTLEQGQNFYDLTSLPGSLRPYTVTDQYLTQIIEYHLLEPQTALSPTPTSPATWTGSRQFSLFDIYNALGSTQNEVLSTSGCTLTRSTAGAPILRAGLILPDTTLDLRRVAWIPEAGNGFDTQIMRQSDAWSKRSFDYNYLTAAPQPPSTWVQSTEPPRRFDVDYVPPVPGAYEVLTVDSGATPNATSAQFFSIPDDWSWLVKFGALAKLFGRESEAKDELRAQYCQARVQRGVQLLSSAASVLAMQFNGAPMAVDAVKNGDNFNSTWESVKQGVPSTCYAAGLNLIGFPTPDAADYGVLPTVVQNAPVPYSPEDYIQVARSDFEVIIDEAQHLASLKLGGAEFLRSIPLHQNFEERAALYNAKLRVQGPFQMPTYRLSQREEERNRRVGAR